MSPPCSAPHSPGSNTKPPNGGGRHRVIFSCLTCRRRKVRCDHIHPVCGACTRGNHVCTYAADGTSSSNSHRVSKPSPAASGKATGATDVQSRLERLEQLLEKAVSKHHVSSPNKGDSLDNQTKYSQVSPSDSQTSQQAMSSDNQDGTLLLDGEQTRFVSSLHYALLADEVNKAHVTFQPYSTKRRCR